MKNRQHIVSTVLIKASMVFLTMVSLLCSSQISAHALKENSAQVILRDGQIEVRLLVDMDRWLHKLQDSQAWLLGDIEELMKPNLSAQDSKRFLSGELTHDTVIKLNNQVVKLKLLSFPYQEKSAHGEFTEVVLTGKHKQSYVENITIEFCKSLGAVHARFVKPIYQLIPAGKQGGVSFNTEVGDKVEMANTTHQHN